MSKITLEIEVSAQDGERLVTPEGTTIHQLYAEVLPILQEESVAPRTITFLGRSKADFFFEFSDQIALRAVLALSYFMGLLEKSGWTVQAVLKSAGREDITISSFGDIVTQFTQIVGTD